LINIPKKASFSAKKKKQPPTTGYYKIMIFLISHVKEIGISFHQLLYRKKHERNRKKSCCVTAATQELP